uniref:G_PROTEIN_RECEP_F1_2 domain-containing protein n=1 Tax=Steinernema glaseri TaxID=37863 RepID=A0A1I7YVQ0_9BILA
MSSTLFAVTHRIGITIHLFSFALSMLLMILKTPKSVVPYRRFLININCWFHLIAFFLSTLSKSSFVSVDGTFCLYYAPNIFGELPVALNVCVVTTAIFNALIGLFLAFAFLLYRSSRLYKKDDSDSSKCHTIIGWLSAVLLHGSVSGGDIYLVLHQHHPAQPKSYDGPHQLLCMATATNQEWIVSWAVYFFCIYFTLILFVIVFLVAIVKYLKAATMHNGSAVKLYKLHLLSLILMSCTPLILYVIPAGFFVFNLVMGNLEIVGTLFDMFVVLLPFQASINSVIIVVTVKPYRTAICELAKSLKARKVSNSVVVYVVSKTR